VERGDAESEGEEVGRERGWMMVVGEGGMCSGK